MLKTWLFFLSRCSVIFQISIFSKIQISLPDSNIHPFCLKIRIREILYYSNLFVFELDFIFIEI